jgi:hypothetical protein
LAWLGHSSLPVALDERSSEFTIPVRHDQPAKDLFYQAALYL